MITYQEITSYQVEEFPNWLFLVSFFLVFFLLGLFFFFRMLPYEEGITMEAIFTSEGSLHVVFPSQKEAAFRQVSKVRILGEKYSVEKIEFLQNQIVNGVFYTEANFTVSNDIGLQVSHYYEVKVIFSSTTWWGRFQKYVKEVFS